MCADVRLGTNQGRNFHYNLSLHVRMTADQAKYWGILCSYDRGDLATKNMATVQAVFEVRVQIILAMDRLSFSHVYSYA